MAKHFTNICLLLAAAALTTNAKICRLPLPKLSVFPPIVFTLNGTLLSAISNDVDDSMYVSLAKGDQVMLSCSPNYFNKIEAHYVQATCKEDQILVIDNVEKNFLKDLSCQMRSIEETLVPVPGCGSNYTAVEFGYTNPIKMKSYVLGQSCYDEELGKTVFVHIKAKSNFVNTDVSDIAIHLKDANYFKVNHPTSRFRIDFLMASRYDALSDRLTESLGINHFVDSLSHNYFVGLNSLMNLQFYNILKLGWNNVMLYGPEVADNLAVLESDILNVNSEKSVDVYIGSNGVVNVNGKAGATELYLKDGRFPVPKYIWIGVRSGSKFVGFSVVNSPSAENDIFFTSKCDQITWLKNVFKTKLVENRKIVCCEYRNFKNNVPEMPELEGKLDLFV